jgi:hypothetical protein
MLYELVNGSAPATIAEVIDRMQAIDSLLPPNDGLKWFNQLYLIVTRQVATEPPQGAWQSPVWITRLDVVFAGLYFGAIRDFVAGRAVPSAWAALFGARYHAGVDRIQFALAGMNAHINHDLALALLSTDDELHVVPGPGDPEFADYQSVNDLLNSAMPAALAMLAADALGMIAQDTGKIGRLLAFWDIRSARELAWEFADHLRSLANSARDCALNAQGALTGALSRAILSAV